MNLKIENPVRGFGSDNHSGIHPEILEAIQNANSGHAASYGTDDLSLEVLEVFRNHFGKKAQVHFVFNGTAANVLCLRAALKPYESYFASDQSHLYLDECGAPEFFSHAKTLLLESENGKILPQSLDGALIRKGDQHYAQPKLLSLTQPTELGTTYSLQEMRTLVDWAKKNQLYTHVDGARLANACSFLGCTFSELTSELNVDLISFGGTKNGLMAGEAVVILNPDLNEGFRYIRKQSAQLPSKTRFFAAQFQAYFSNELWSRIAGHSHKMAKLLEFQLRNIPGIEITAPVESNAVFAKIPPHWISPLRKRFFFYVWDERTFVCRLMTSWDTQESDVHGFAELARGLSKKDVL